MHVMLWILIDHDLFDDFLELFMVGFELSLAVDFYELSFVML
jgi:hypothetical protein